MHLPRSTCALLFLVAVGLALTCVPADAAAGRRPASAQRLHRVAPTVYGQMQRRATATKAHKRTIKRHRVTKAKPKQHKPTKTKTKTTARTTGTGPTSTAPTGTTPTAGGGGAVTSDGELPSGQTMPTGNFPGWNEVFSDNFDGSTLDSDKWRLYWGTPGGDPGGWFDPDHVSVGNGELAISGYQDAADGGKWATGGLSSSPGLSQTYGKYLVRFRMDAGQGIAHAILLWPTDNTWPPEIDFSEDNGANRQTTYATLHYGADNTQVQSQVPVDLTKWHTLGVEWTPGHLVYTLDGRAWASVANANVPSTPMTLDLQTQAWACGTSTWEQCPNASTPSHVNMDVDWVVAYAMG